MRSVLLTVGMHISALKLSQRKHESYMFDVVRHFTNEAGFFAAFCIPAPLFTYICLCVWRWKCTVENYAGKRIVSADAPTSNSVVGKPKHTNICLCGVR